MSAALNAMSCMTCVFVHDVNVRIRLWYVYVSVWINVSVAQPSRSWYPCQRWSWLKMANVHEEHIEKVTTFQELFVLAGVETEDTTLWGSNAVQGVLMHNMGARGKHSFQCYQT